MTTFNWRVLSPHTIRAYEHAARDFQQVTGLKANQATVESIEAWRASMEGRGLAVGTIRQRLSALAVISGVKVLLPKRTAARRRLLSLAQVRNLMTVVSDPADRLLLVRLLALGPSAKTAAQPADSDLARIMGAEQDLLSAQETTRKLKRYARRAGILESEVNLRTWYQTGRQLLTALGPAGLAGLLGAQPIERSHAAWKPLHGIGRRARN